MKFFSILEIRERKSKPSCKGNTGLKPRVLMIKVHYNSTRYVWVRGVMVLDVGCEFRDRGSIPSEYLIPRNTDLGQVNFAIA